VEINTGLSLSGWGSLKFEKIKFGHDSRGTLTRNSSDGEVHQKLCITDPSSPQVGRLTIINSQLSKDNFKETETKN
jgi:hypothetical protein